MAVAIVLVLLIVGTVAFHVFTPWWFTPLASNWEMVDDTVDLTFWVTGAVFVGVNLFMAWTVVRYRHRKGQRAHFEPENKKLEWWLTGLTSVGIIALLAPGLDVWAKFVTVPAAASDVEILGQQWSWSYRFPGEDGKLGTTNSRLISLDNPFGINPQDPAGRDDRLVKSAELHLPLDKPVRLLMRSKDVLHQFAVPQFRVKMDMVPGMITQIWVTPTRTGTFDALCEQLCGLPHFAMRGRVVVDDTADFATWLGAQPTYTQVLEQTAGDPVAGQALYAVCSACHGQEGEGNQTLNAPRLSGQAGWYLAKQLKAYKDGVRGNRDDDVWAKQMAPFATILADDTAIRDIVAYIGSLPERPAPATVKGDAGRGKALYASCAACHGGAGQGFWATNAPRLARMSDWYLAQQLRNFQQGIRGGHAQDFSGSQMASMARSLRDDRAIDDLVSYVHPL